MNNTVLVVKNLPEASLNMREIFSSYYPTSIKPFGRRRVLLTFPDPQYANFVLHKLHQTEVAGRIISVEYYRFGKQFQRDESSTEKMPRIPTYLKKLYAMCDGLRLDEPPPPYLKYDYPKINNDILDSISIALLSNAKFYTQVIHLMNRMNMDPPFGPKKVYLCPTKSSSEFREIATQTDPVAFASDVESELESDSERISRPKKISRKRKLPDNEELLKQKVKQMIHVTSQIKTKSIHKEKKDLCNIFEIKKPFVEHKIAMNFKKVKLAESVVENVEKLTPSVVEFVPPDDLKSNRIPESQLSELPVFKNYKKGNPSNKLYIKNLNKDVTDIDLRSIYEKFTSPLEIKVMQQGRMKGQAFVTFTKLTDDQGNIVENALNETNGFILKNKPMVVCFGKKQLGLLETIYVDAAGRQHSSRRHKMQKLAVQPYDYVIAVDFEATCWENIAPPKWRESEIIEFPAVLINLKTGKIEAEFHKYIMPIESPKLSAFCTELTGITQKIVDTGIPLQTALMMFHEWLRKELRTRNLHLPKMSKDNKIGNCAFVTWSDWDFGICLAKECQRKRLKKPPFFNQWVDLRAIFREWYNYKPINFSDALLHVGLEFEGREHAGIDDAKNLAALACKMVKDGASLAITKDLTPFQLNMNF